METTPIIDTRKQFVVVAWIDGYGNDFTVTASSEQSALDRVRRHLDHNQIEADSIELADYDEDAS